MEPCYTMLGSVVGNRGNRESSPLDGTRKMSEGLNIDLGSRWWKDDGEKWIACG